MRRVALILFLSVGLAFGQAPRPPVDQLSQLTDVQITGPINGQVLTYDSGLLKWKNAAGGGGGGAPGGSNTQVQYNNAGAFGGAAGFTFNSPDFLSFDVNENGTVGMLINNSNSGTTANSYFGVSNGPNYSYFSQAGTNSAPSGMIGAGDSLLYSNVPLNIIFGNTVRFGLYASWGTELGRFGSSGLTLDSGSFNGNGSVPTGGATGQALTKNSNTNYDVHWATVSGGGTPGGSSGQVQYNNAGAFGGFGSWDGTTFTFTNTGNQNAITSNTVFNNSSGTGAQAVFISKNGTYQANYGITGTGLSPFSDLVANMAYLYTDAAGLGLFANNGSGKVLIAAGGLSRTALFDSDGGLKFGSLSDTGIARNAAGIMEFNNGTAGQYRDVKVRTVIHNAYTVATLPVATAGMVAYITDGTASLAWGATATGGASTKYLVWYNGTNWTVVGK